MKRIDLKQPFFPQDVRDLLASVDDSRITQLRVTDDGFAYIHVGRPDEGLDGVLFRLESWYAGSGYVGAEAAEDNGWVMRIYAALKDNWPLPRSSYIDFF